MSAAAGELRLGVYVHWPYCARICPYCDFNVYKNRAIDAEAWKRALGADLAHWARLTGPRKLSSLYFGGGTPSLAPPAVIAHMIETCADLWGFEPGAEITIEANPGQAEQSLFETFAGLGVNRLSLGVQSLNDDALRFLGRDHTGQDARRAIEAGLKAFPRLTFDLIYARPAQSAEDWRRELGAALTLGARHLSLYQLTVEPGTAFDRAVVRGKWAPPSDDIGAALFDIAQEETARAGLPAYEISNHAAPGEESRHNLLYWTYQDYVGVGPGAHGRFWRDGARVATHAIDRPERYLAAVEAGAPHTEEVLGRQAVFAERLTMGLRLAAGVVLDPSDYDALAPRAAPLIETGFLAWSGAVLRATASGRKVLNALLARLL